MKTNRQNVIIVRVNDEEKKMVKELKEKKAINMSALIRNFIRDYYEKNQ